MRRLTSVLPGAGSRWRIRSAPPLLPAARDRPVFGQVGSSRCATSLPQIPGVILTNTEIPEDSLIGRIRRWAGGSRVLSKGDFDLLQLAEQLDGKLAPRAVCGLLRTHVMLADGGEPVRALVTVFYRSRDMLNREFWEDQVRRLCDIVAEEFFAGQRGVQLMVHHNPPIFPLGLEVGDHRLLAEFGALHVVGPSWGGGASGGSNSVPELVQDVTELSWHRGFHRLCALGEANSSQPPDGTYVLRRSGEAVCGVSVLGSQPLRLVCGGAWAAPGNEADLGVLIGQVRKIAGKSVVCLVGDRRDPYFRRLSENPETSQALGGLWRSSAKNSGVVLTGAPVGLEPEEQARLATAPFLMPWEFIPFHSGRIMLI